MCIRDRDAGLHGQALGTLLLADVITCSRGVTQMAESALISVDAKDASAARSRSTFGFAPIEGRAEASFIYVVTSASCHYGFNFLV